MKGKDGELRYSRGEKTQALLRKTNGRRKLSAPVSARAPPGRTDL